MKQDIKTSISGSSIWIDVFFFNSPDSKLYMINDKNSESNSKINSFKLIFKQLYLHLDLLISSSYIVGGSVCFCNYCDDPKQKICDKLFLGDL